MDSSWHWSGWPFEAHIKPKIEFLLQENWQWVPTEEKPRLLSPSSSTDVLHGVKKGQIRCLDSFKYFNFGYFVWWAIFPASFIGCREEVLFCLHPRIFWNAHCQKSCPNYAWNIWKCPNKRWKLIKWQMPINLIIDHCHKNSAFFI